MNLFIYLFLRLLASNVSVRYILKVVIFYRVFYRTVLQCMLSAEHGAYHS